MALDLKNPGGKEILIFGGGAAGLALIYFALNKNKGTAATPAQQAPQSTSGTGGGLGSTGTASTTGGVGTAGFTPGNVFSDITTSVPADTATGSTGVVTHLPAPRVQHTPQGAGAILGSGGTGSSGPPVSGIGSGVASVSVGAKTVYNALRAAGLSAAEAAGVLGNAQNESNFRVDVSALDTNGKYSYGLVQWNAGSHPNASQFVTGNLAHDLQTQVAAIVAAVKGLGLPKNASAGQVAGAFASQFEGCVGCQPGGSQYSSRVANANAYYNAILQGKFAPPKPVVSTGGYNNFPGGLAAWRKRFGQSTTPATPKQIQGLFPTVKPRAKPVKLGAGLSSRASKAQLSNLGKGLSAGLARLTAAIYPKPAPRRPAYRPTPKRGPGHPLLR